MPLSFAENYTGPNLSVNFAVNSIGLPLPGVPYPPSEVKCAPQALTTEDILEEIIGRL